MTLYTFPLYTVHASLPFLPFWYCSCEGGTWISLSEGASLPRSLLLGSEVRAAQSSGEWPGVSVTCRERLAGVGVRREGAKAAVERVLVAGTRRDAAAEGGGRRGALVEGRGGGGMELNVGGFNDGGLLVGGLEGEGVSFVDAFDDEGEGALGVADVRGSPASDTLSSACTSSIIMDGELPQWDCASFGSSSGEVSLAGCDCWTKPLLRRVTSN